MRQFYFGGKGCSETDETALLLDNENLTFRMGPEGVAEIYHDSLPSQNLIEVPTISAFSKDYFKLVEMCSDGAMRSFAFSAYNC
jgi:hypothetical protein